VVSTWPLPVRCRWFDLDIFSLPRTFPALFTLLFTLTKDVDLNVHQALSGLPVLFRKPGNKNGGMRVVLNEWKRA
jgi:hypothetical protein